MRIGLSRLGAFGLLFFVLFSVTPSRADTYTNAIEVAQQLRIASDPTWNALLHIANGRCYIQTGSFLLAPEACSPDEELRELLYELLKGSPETIQDLSCRFPARRAFLEYKLANHGVIIPNLPCPELIEFEQKAPADQLALVFASENITHPMSMLGHVFLKLSGRRDDGRSTEHAASFFTQISSLNIPKVIFDTFLLGLPSYFALKPYSDYIELYKTKENRSLWEYNLTIDKFKAKLIQLHIWELRSTGASYYFVGYNCATVVLFLISVANPDVLNDMPLWVSPLDVVRRTYKHRLIESRQFIPSTSWQVRSFGSELGSNETNQIAQILEHGEEEEIRKLGALDSGGLHLAFADALLKSDRRSPRLSPERAALLTKTIEDLRENRPPENITANDLKDPLDSDKSRRFVVSGAHHQSKFYSKIGILPISHFLSDDNRHLFSESSLKIGEVSILYSPAEEDLKMEKVNLYSYESLVPFNKYVGGITSRAAIGVEQQLDRNLNSFTAGYVTFGLGRTIVFSDDFQVFSTINGSGGLGKGDLYLSFFPEVGAILYEILNMKTLAAYRLICNQGGGEDCYNQVSATHTIFTKRLTPYLKFENNWKDGLSEQHYEAGLEVYF